MDLEDFSARAHALALSEEASQVPGFAALVIEADPPAKALLPDRRAWVDVAPAEPDPASGAPRYTVSLFPTAMPDEPDALERALLFGLERVAERAAADEAVPDDEALFRAHARFVRGLDVPAAWYRRGERMGAGLWAVDLDVFAELALSREAWAALRGQRASLSILGEALDLEIPADADPDEALTLEGGGLFEPAPGIEDDDLGEDDGRYGDLHVIPYVF